MVKGAEKSETGSYNHLTCSYHQDYLTPKYLHPYGRIDLHERVRNENDVHAVENGGENGMPEAYFPLEVENANHLLAFRVIASGGQRPAVT